MPNDRYLTSLDGKTVIPISPRSEAIEMLSVLKKEIHNKAIYPGITDVMPYVPLKDIDGIIVKMANMLYEEGKHRES
jgi:hypothetical protein